MKQYKLLISVILIVIAAVFCSIILDGTPKQLPGVTLESKTLLHTLRAGFLVAVALGLLAVLKQAKLEELPIEIGTYGFRYREVDRLSGEERQVIDRLENAEQQQDKINKDLYHSIDILEQRISKLESLQKGK